MHGHILYIVRHAYIEHFSRFVFVSTEIELCQMQSYHVPNNSKKLQFCHCFVSAIGLGQIDTRLRHLCIFNYTILFVIVNLELFIIVVTPRLIKDILIIAHFTVLKVYINTKVIH